MSTILVKLGGSVITRKQEESTLRPKVLTRLGQELSTGWSRAGKPALVVVHGAGSFGHPYAHKWALNAPPPGPRGGRERGVAVTGYHVRVLHSRVLKSLVGAGLPAISISPAPISHMKAGEFVDLAIGPFQGALQQRAIPVSFGDVVPDTVWGYSILSGDIIMRELARALKPDLAVFVSDVDGLLDRGHANRLLPQVSEDALAHLGLEPHGRDVTGGVGGKVKVMLQMRDLGVRTGLINGLREGRLEEAVSGLQVRGSWT